MPGLGLAFLLAAAPLQALVDATPTYGHLVVPPGHHRGPLVIDRPLTVDGQGRAVIDGAGAGTVVRVTAPGARLTGVTVRGSGRAHHRSDAAVEVTADGVRVDHVTIEDSLIGVHLLGASRAVVCGNVIHGTGDEPGLRGDGVRIWNGTRNLVLGNEIRGVRDVSLTNAPGNRVERNLITGGRYGLELVFAPRTWVVDNVFDANAAGVAVLYSPRVVVRGNRLQHSRGMAGTCLTFKESALAVVDGNVILHCSVGARVNAPTSSDDVVVFLDNRFAHNVTAIDFYGENGGHLLHNNRFEKNLVQVGVSAPMAARRNDWLGNHWDDYQGFDRDGNGVGDTPHELYAFTDTIWQENPKATFFRSSPALELLDFLERLAPFSAPELTLADPRPAFDGLRTGPEAPVPPFAPSCQPGRWPFPPSWTTLP